MGARASEARSQKGESFVSASEIMRYFVGRNYASREGQDEWPFLTHSRCRSQYFVTQQGGGGPGRTVVQEQKEMLCTDHSILLSLLQSRIGSPLG